MIHLVFDMEGGNRVNVSFGQLRKFLFGVPSAEEVVYRQLGLTKEAWQRFQPVFHAVLGGYNATLEDSRFEVLKPRLDAVEAELRGFAYEGAGMGLAILDCLAPWKKRLQAFADGPGEVHKYLVYVGSGLALARLRRHPERFLPRNNPFLRWLVVDGYGFHEGIFAYRRSVERQVVPTRLSVYACRVFDQGLGRSIWFSSGADVDRIAATLTTFPSPRQADLWSGVGAASAYAGGAERATLESLRTVAGPYKSQLARGAAVAADARRQAGNPAPHTQQACEVFCGCSSDMAAHIANVARQNIPVNSSNGLAYEIWRQRVEAQFAGEQSVGETSETRFVP